MIKAQTIKLLDTLRNPQAQLAVITAMLIYFVALISWQHQLSHYADPVQTILQVHPHAQRLASKVNAGLHINNFSVFSFNKNEFTMDALVWFSFPVGTESLHTIEQFSFQNGEITQKSLPTIKIVNKVAIISFQTTVEFKTHLDYRYFPVSDHRLSIVLENRSVTPSELCFTSQPSHFALGDNLQTSTWKPEKKVVQTGYIKSFMTDEESDKEVSYPCVSFTLEFANGNIKDLISLYFPLFILFLFGFFSLMIDVRKDNLRTNMMVTSMPTLALFRLVIDNVAPPASKITLVDYLYYTLVSLALILLLFQVYILLVQRRISTMSEKEQKYKTVMLEFMNSGLFVTMVVTLVSVITYIHFI